MERYTDPFVYFVVGIEFTEVEVDGIQHLFYADLVDIDPVPGLELAPPTGNNGIETPKNQLGGPGSVTTVIRERILVHSLPGVATVFFKGDPSSICPPISEQFGRLVLLRNEVRTLRPARIQCLAC